jgi:SAM-dependent methyltransferase
VAGDGNSPSRGPERCAACGAAALHPHLRVAGEAGVQGLIPTTDRYGTALADLVRCAACGHAQLERIPTAAELSRAYAEAESDDYLAEETGQRATARRTLTQIELHVDRGRLLDLGCWLGFLLAEARERGWEAVGVEPSEFASTYARDRFHLDVRTEELMDAELKPRSFDAAVMADVIEHLPDPGGALDRVAALLAPGGVIALTLPDAGSRLARAMGRRWWSVIPTHVHYFTRASLRAVLERRGYGVLAIGTAPKTFTVRYYLERIGGYARGPARTLVRAAETAGLAERLWTPDFRDRMLVVARAPEPA